MNLLVSNDDGIFASGIRVLANTLATAGHQVTVVCPDRERSATGHGLTLHDPLRVEEVDSIFHPNIRAWACSGTPSDCIKLALGALLERPPDVVLSGINHGSNLGTDVLYSGTVSAAMEGVIEGIPGIALSLASFSDCSTGRDFQPAANFAKLLVDRLLKHPLPHPMLLNVNIPPVPQPEITGVAMTRQGIRRYFDWFEKRVDPRGKTYYWLAGEVLEEVDDLGVESAETAEFKAVRADLDWPKQPPTDVQAIRQNYITITPLQYNLTCTLGLTTLQNWDLTSAMSEEVNLGEANFEEVNRAN